MQTISPERTIQAFVVRLDMAVVAACYAIERALPVVIGLTIILAAFSLRRGR